MANEQTKKSLSQIDSIVSVSCIAVSLLLAASHWFFLENALHRIGDVAWNALFQIFGNILAVIGSISILVNALAGKVSRMIGILSALILFLTAVYCLFNAFGTMVRM